MIDWIAGLLVGIILLPILVIQGIVVNSFLGNSVYIFSRDTRILIDNPNTELDPDLTAIEKPFGLLDKEVQERLRAVNNGENIQCFTCNRWISGSPFFNEKLSYRLDPDWKEFVVKEKLYTAREVVEIVREAMRGIKDGER